MRVPFDQGTPVPLREFLQVHSVATAAERGWSRLSNGELIGHAEAEFDLLITTDQNLRYQQNLGGRRLAILVLKTTSWPRIRSAVVSVVAAVDSIAPAEYRELDIP